MLAAVFLLLLPFVFAISGGWISANVSACLVFSFSKISPESPSLARSSASASADHSLVLLV
jgi:hypothetical protein